METLGLGFVGTGSIARKIAVSARDSTRARLAAVSSRSLERAEAFASEHPGAVGVCGVEALLGRDDVEAVYIATPTMAKETIALEAIASGRHVLVEKPFADADSVRRMVEAAEAAGVAFLDATHFVHHPVNLELRREMTGLIGRPLTLHASFFHPIEDRSNIRYDASQEPTGVLGDLAWYALRAAVEYLEPEGAVRTVSAQVDRDAETGAVVRVCGMVGFEGGQTATFDAGFLARVMATELCLVGERGMVRQDDYVRSRGVPGVSGSPASYWHRAQGESADGERRVVVASDVRANVLMLDHLADEARGADRARIRELAGHTLRTQALVDAVWGEIC